MGVREKKEKLNCECSVGCCQMGAASPVIFIYADGLLSPLGLMATG